MNRLYFGDNLHVLREHVADQSVDLVYLDPPFNSKRDYNLLFKTPKGHESDAQITAFEDSWHWGGGIDGLIFFQDDKGAAKKIVVSVKGGGNVNVAMVRDLAHVVAREKAEIGLFVTLTEPTKPMETEAVKEGFYVSPQTGAQFPRIQILTIAGLLDGTERARYPDLSQGGHTFKKARRDQGRPAEQQALL